MNTAISRAVAEAQKESGKEFKNMEIKRLQLVMLLMLAISVFLLQTGCKEGSAAKNADSAVGVDSTAETGTESSRTPYSGVDTNTVSDIGSSSDLFTATDSEGNHGVDTQTDNSAHLDSTADIGSDTDSLPVIDSDGDTNTVMGEDTDSPTESGTDNSVRDTNITSDSDTINDMGGDTGEDTSSDNTHSDNDTSTDTIIDTKTDTAPDIGTDPATLCDGGDVWPGDYAIRNVADRDGLVGFACVMGDVSVSSSGISNLSGLDNLKYIGGELAIANSEDLISVDGLSGLVHIAGNLILENNPVISNLDSFSSLTSVGGSVHIVNDPALWKLYGLRSLQKIGGDVTLDTLPDLDSFNGGFGALQSVGGSVSIHGLSLLTSLEGFADLKTIGGDLLLSNLVELSSISIHGLLSVGGAVNIHGTPKMVDFDIKSLTSISGDFTYQGNNDSLELLVNFDGLSSLQSVGGLFLVSYAYALKEIILPVEFHSAESVSISKNINLERIQADGLTRLDILNIESPALTTFSLKKLETVESRLFIDANSLESVDFDQLTTVGTFILENFGQIIDFTSFSTLEAITGDFVTNSLIPSTEGLEKITAIGGGLVISVDNYAGLAGVETIGGTFQVLEGNVKKLEELTRLKRIGGLFWVSGSLGMYGLETLVFPSLESVGGDIMIVSNPKLHTISFPMLTTVDGDGIRIRSNPAFSNCQVDDIATQLVDLPDVFCIYDNLEEAACPETTDGCI